MELVLYLTICTAELQALQIEEMHFGKHLGFQHLLDLLPRLSLRVAIVRLHQQEVLQLEDFN